MKKLQFKVLLLILILAGTTLDLAAQTRINFRRGSTSATVKGTLASQGKRSYVLSARSGQTISANVSSPSSGCVGFTGSGESSYSDSTTSGNNYISLSNFCRGSVKFTLTVSIQ